MARIPNRVAGRQLETSIGVQYPQGGGPIGAAMEGFGNQLQDVATRFAAMREKEEAFDTKIIEQEMENELNRLDMENVANAAPDGSGMHDTMYGELDPATGAARKPGMFDTIFDKYAQRVPESQRQRWMASKEAIRGQRSVRMAGAQMERRRNYEAVKIEEQKTGFLNRVAEADPDDIDSYNQLLSEFEQLVMSSKKDSLAKEVDIIKMREDAAIALNQAVRERDPEKAKRMLGMPTQPRQTAGGYVGADPGAVRITFADRYVRNAQRYGSDASEAALDQRLVSSVKSAFASLGINEVRITSGARNKAHNEAAGGAGQSRHMHNDAVDIDVTGYSVAERRNIIRALSESGVGGIGVGNNIIHADMGAKRAWGYANSAGGGAVPEQYRDLTDAHKAGSIAQVSSPATRPASTPAAFEDMLAQTVGRIIGAESSGNPDAKNSKSTATGLGQHIASTWLRTVRKHRPDLANSMSTEALLALRRDGALSREMTTALARDNAEYLTNRRLPVTPANLHLAHFAGAAGAAQILTASPGASVESILGASKVRANPFLRGMTASDLVSWAADKQGGPVSTAGTRQPFVQGEIDPRMAALPFDKRLALANQADAAIREQQALLRGTLETTINNAPTAIQNTGRYDGMMPTEDHFVRAYGPEDGPQRFRAFDTAVQTASQMHDMKTMPNAEIQQLVTSAQPTSSGDGAVLESQRYEALSSAAAAVLKARRDDPAQYVQTAFTHVGDLWSAALAPGAPTSAYQTAVAASIAAQEQIGIAPADIRPLTGTAAEQAADRWGDEALGHGDRIGAAVHALMSVSDPQHRRAVFEQLVKAGVPEETEGAFAALERGDTGAANRLFQAVLTDPSALPGKLEYTQDNINSRVQTEWFDDDGIADRFYGLTYGSTENSIRAQRDSKLLKNAVIMRLRDGESLTDAVRGAGRDLYGDVQVLDGDSTVNIRALIPADADPEAYRIGLAAQLDEVKAVLYDVLEPNPDASTSDGTMAVQQAVQTIHPDIVLAEGFFHQVDDEGGFVFMNTQMGGGRPVPVSDADGNVVIFRPDLTLTRERPPPPSTQPRESGSSSSPDTERPDIAPEPGMEWRSPGGWVPSGGATPPSAPPSAPSGDPITAPAPDRLTPSGSIPMSPGSGPMMPPPVLQAPPYGTVPPRTNPRWGR